LSINTGKETKSLADLHTLKPKKDEK